MHPAFRWGKLLSDSRALLCHAGFPADSKIYGVVNSDLILFSMLVIYFKINILVYFCLISVCFALLTTMRVSTMLLQGPSLRTCAVYLML